MNVDVCKNLSFLDKYILDNKIFNLILQQQNNNIFLSYALADKLYKKHILFMFKFGGYFAYY